MAHPGVQEALWNHLRDRERGEGYREAIYIDRLGLPTVGVGMMLRDETQVRRLAWFQAGSRAQVADDVAVQAWRPFRPVGDGAPSQAGREALAARGSGATVIPQCVTNEDSVHAYFIELLNTCESRAVEAMSASTWEASPADAQFAILMHLWRAPNELRGGWRDFRAALQRRDWMEAAEECTWQGMRRCRREDLQSAFRNAAFVEQVYLERGTSKSILYFPNQFVAMTEGRWRGVQTEAAGTQVQSTRA